jgi:hypothetical protein
MSSADQLLLSIEPTEGEVYIHGFNLGTDIAVARSIAAEMFASRNKTGLPTRTVAILLRGHVMDCYDGTWTSEGDVWNCDDLFSEAPSCSQK